MGDRREHFATSDDVWALFKIIAEERMKRELEPTVVFLDNLIASPEFALENENAQKRIKATRDFVQTLSIWANDILKLPVAVMSKVLKLGAGIQKFLK